MEHSNANNRQDQILALLRAQDPRGMELLYEHYGGALYSIVERILSQPEEAREVFHDCLMRVWQNIDSYDTGSGRLYTWMARIARNAAIDRTRSRSFKNRRKTDSTDVLVGKQDALSVSIPTDGIGVPKLLEQLDDQHRPIIELLFLKEYTQSEVAKTLGIPLGTVKTRSRRALQQLRKLLGGELVILFILHTIF